MFGWYWLAFGVEGWLWSSTEAITCVLPVVFGFAFICISYEYIFLCLCFCFYVSFFLISDCGDEIQAVCSTNIYSISTQSSLCSMLWWDFDCKSVFLFVSVCVFRCTLCLWYRFDWMWNYFALVVCLFVCLFVWMFFLFFCLFFVSFLFVCLCLLEVVNCVWWVQCVANENIRRHYYVLLF